MGGGNVSPLTVANILNVNGNSSVSGAGASSTAGLGNNNGLGNNLDSYDVSNPGKGKGGQGGGIDPSGAIDDEKRLGSPKGTH